MDKEKLREFLKDWSSVVGPVIEDSEGQKLWDGLLDDLYKKHFKHEPQLYSHKLDKAIRKEVYCLLVECKSTIYHKYCDSDLTEKDYWEMVEKLNTIMEMDEFKFKPQKSCIYYSVRGKCTREDYSTSFHPKYKNRDHDCLYENQDDCPISD